MFLFSFHERERERCNGLFEHTAQAGWPGNETAPITAPAPARARTMEALIVRLVCGEDVDVSVGYRLVRLVLAVAVEISTLGEAELFHAVWNERRPGLT